MFDQAHGVAGEDRLTLEPERPERPEDAIELVPPSIEEMEPGPVLAAFISSIDVTRVSGHDLVRVLRAQRRMASFYAAKEMESVDAITRVYEGEFEGDREMAVEAAAAEVRAGLTLTRRAADAGAHLALQLRRELPALWTALAAGAVDLARARVVADAVAGLDRNVVPEVVRVALEAAPRLTTGQLRAELRRWCIEADPDAASDRYEAAVERRRVTVEATPDGTADLVATDLPAERAVAIKWRIDRIARSLRSRPGEVRTMDQLRADVMLDLLEGGRQQTSARVEVRADLSTLIGLDERAADLDGFGPVVADIARRLSASTERIGYTVRHGDGSLSTGAVRRRPDAGTGRRVRAAYPTCVFPGCRMPATDCDLDHRETWADGGPTAEHNLAPLCRHDHHRLRHTVGWKYQRVEGGDHRWSSPLGHTYTTPFQPP